jgi:hypothetical protein
MIISPSMIVILVATRPRLLIVSVAAAAIASLLACGPLSDAYGYRIVLI